MTPRPRKRKRMDSTFLLLGFLIFGALNCASARFTVLGPDTPVIVSAGDDALLRCRLSIDDALTEARWFRVQSDKASIIHLYQEGKDQHECQIPSYTGRTELLRADIAHGDVSLKISKIGPLDEGKYRCYLETDSYYNMADFELKVTAVGSAPSFYIENVKGGSINVTCKSDGWYPEPKVLNENANGTDVMTTRQEDGFYRIQYSRVITEKSDRSFSCAFKSSSSDQRREATLHASDQYFFEKPSEGSDVSTIIAVSVILTLIVAAAAALTVYLYFKKRGNSAKGNSESVPLKTCEEGNSESVPLKTDEEGKKLEYLEAENKLQMKEKEPLDRDLAREMKEKDTLKEQLAALSKQLVDQKALVGPAPFSTENISLDPDTAHPKLFLSGEQKIVRYKEPTANEMTGSNKAGRFDTTPCIVGTAGFTEGRHSWVVEVQMEGGLGWAIGLIRKSVRRVGEHKLRPQEGIWAVGQVMDEYQAFDDTLVELKVNEAVRRIRIYLDCEGQLAFYNADTMSHIYTFMAKFKEEVFPFFRINDDKTTLSLR